MGAIRETSKDKLYQELGFESLNDRRQLSALLLFFLLYAIKE